MHIEIDGQSFDVEPGSMIIEVADKAGIAIPRFCYHKKLSIAANCRMCLVDVAKAPKPLPACATPVSDGMKVFTQSERARNAQKAVMEFLLINHPLDCPICDQGGECELQDISLMYGKDVSRFTEGKRFLNNDPLGALISTDMTRCIHCTRCVRFGEEVAGLRELGATGRGEMTQIGTFVEANVSSEISGNVIDLCPVGALTAKPSRYTARSWELDRLEGIAGHDCLGSNIYYHVRREEVMRVVPRDNETVNEVWLSDRDRFSYQGFRAEDRLLTPLANRNGKWESIHWVEAFKLAEAAIAEVLDTQGAAAVGALISPNATLEEAYLFQKYCRARGITNIDHRLRQLDFRGQEHAPLYPHLGLPLAEIEELESALLIGCNVHKELPLLGVRLRKSAIHDGLICAVNPIECEYNFPVAHQIVATGGDLLGEVAGLAAAVCKATKVKGSTAVAQLLADVASTRAQQALVTDLIQTQRKLVLLGHYALMHPESACIQALANYIREALGAHLGTLSDGANSAGAWLAGCVPHRLAGGQGTQASGLHVRQQFEQPLSLYLLFGFEPEFDSVYGAKAQAALAKAQQVIAFTPYAHDSLKEVADLLLPITPYSETPGTFINGLGEWQSFQSHLSPIGESRPGWKVLRVLGNQAGLDDFEHQDIAEVFTECRQEIGERECFPEWPAWAPLQLTGTEAAGEWIRLAPLPLYASDAIVRRAGALQATPDAVPTPKLELSFNSAKKLNLKPGLLAKVSGSQGSVKLEVAINAQVPDGCVVVHQAKAETLGLGLPFGSVRVEEGT